MYESYFISVTESNAIVWYFVAPHNNMAPLNVSYVSDQNEKHTI